MTETILVTGGGGFLGSHLCEKLLEKGYSVIAMDDFSTGSRTNLLRCLENSKFQISEWDVENPISLNVDGILNFACPASPVQYQKNPVKTMKTNVLGAINVLELARKLAIPVLQASTSEIYGNPLINPQPEEYFGNVNCFGPRACYDEGKRAAETLFFDFYMEHKVDVRIARIFNTYGPRMAIDDGRVVSNLIVQALRNNPVTLYGDGKQTRAFCYVDDLVDGILDLFFISKCHTPVNLGNPESISILQLASKIIDMTNSKSEIIFSPLPTDDPILREPRISKAREEINWEARTSLDEGLARTIKYFEKLIDS